MPHWPQHPFIYEINTWIWLHELSQQAGRALTLDQVPDATLDRLAARGFDAVWLMGVWQRSAASRAIARAHPHLQSEFDRALSDRTPDDMVGSPYAIGAYQVDPALGGDGALDALRERLARRGIRLVLDFVSNHVAIDHPWVQTHPERFVHGDPDAAASESDDWFRAGPGGPVLAHGRDPYFPGWTDTAQLDYRRPDTREAMVERLEVVAERCDGLRCDMAMLSVSEVFRRTWGGEWEGPEFWPAAIGTVKARRPGFRFLAEVYWDLEYRLVTMGFDHAYDKTLYDRLRRADASNVRTHLSAVPEWQARLVRFVENHDEPRVRGVLGADLARCAATLTLTLPGARLVHDGQLEGRRLRVPVQLRRRAEEAPDPATASFYDRLLAACRRPVMHDGHWALLQPRPEWDGNPSWRNFVAHRWLLGEVYLFVVTNLGEHRAQCFLDLDRPGLGQADWVLVDQLGEARYERTGAELVERGLYLDMAGRTCHLFELQRA